MTIRKLTYLLFALSFFSLATKAADSLETQYTFDELLLKSRNKAEYSGKEILHYAEEAVALAMNSGDTNQLLTAYENMASSLKTLEYKQSAAEYFQKSATLHLKKGNTRKAAETYDEISLLYDHLGDYPKSLKASYKELDLYNQLKDTSGVAYSYNNIGVVHYYQGKYDLAREYYKRALKLFEQMDDDYGKALCYNNIANIYADRKQYEKALELYNKGYEIDLRRDDTYGQSISLSNIGDTYTVMKNYGKAQEHLQRSLQLAKELNDKWLQLSPLKALGNLYLLEGKYGKAIEAAKTAEAIADSVSALAELSEAYDLLTGIYKKKNDAEKALHYYEKYNAVADTLFNIKNSKTLSDLEVKYKVKDKSRKIELLEKQREIEKLTHQKEIGTQKTRNKILMGGLGIILLFAGLIYWGLVIKRKANKELSRQKLIVEEKNNEITDSINYAERIQAAILPSSEYLEKHLKDHFIFYRPKDIVAGDFYWMESLAATALDSGDAKQHIFFAVADCTGHGVPGAMVSVVCSNALNQSVHEHKLTKPGAILDKTRQLVLKNFEKGTHDVKDGMDISLCAYHIKQRKLEWAGANNPLWIIRKGELITCKPDKQPIGASEAATNFQTHAVDLKKNDVIYLFSDGYADQFGGEKNKKFKIKNLKHLLLSIHEKPMNEQQELVKSKFESWKGDNEQVDDVCLMGIRI